MRFTTIWSLPGLSLRERLNRTLDLWAMSVSDYLPKRLTYWIAMRQIGKATMTSQNVPATPLDNVLQNLGNIREGKPLEQFKWTESERADIWHAGYVAADNGEDESVNPYGKAKSDV